MRKLALAILIILAVIGLFLLQDKKNGVITIGIIEPLQHKAMDEIVAGFTESLAKDFHKRYVIKIENAQNDNNLQRAIFQKMKDANYDMIVPIGTTPTQMAISMIKNQPIVSLAAKFSEGDRSKLKSCNIAVVHDEIPAEQIIKFIREVYPNITNIALIHSSSDKVLPEVNDTIAVGKSYRLTVNHFMASSLPELMAVAQALPPSTQAIFILKDNLIVSGIGTLSKLAEQRKIPLITSDEGSVEAGATFALGVLEKQIGIEGGELAKKILEGASACSLPIHEMNHLNIFVNLKSLSKQNLKIEPIQSAAKLLRYQINFVAHPLTENK